MLLGKMTGKPVIIDNGSWFSKNGFAGEKVPCSVFPTLVGYPRYQSIMTDVDHYASDYYTGEEAMNLRGVLKLIYPVENGIIKDWSAMEKIWEYTFHDVLKVDTSQHPVLLADDIYNSDKNREKMVEVMFETFSCPAVNVSRKQELAIETSNRNTGLVIDAGGSSISIVPVLEGSIVLFARKKLGIGGRDITERLRRLHLSKGYRFGHNGREIFTDIKEKLCYVALDYEEELKKNIEKRYALPDGELEILGQELFTAPEALFKPAMIGSGEPPLHEAAIASVMDCNERIRSDLFQNIFLCGGSSLFPGFQERFTRELKKLAPAKYKERVKVTALPDRGFATWIGGSMIAARQDFYEKWILRKDHL